MKTLLQCLIYAIAVILLVLVGVLLALPSPAIGDEPPRIEDPNAFYFDYGGKFLKVRIEDFIRRTAREYGVNENQAVCVAKKESINFNEDVLKGKRLGDGHLTCLTKGSPLYGLPIRSRGLWQWNECANWNVSDADSFNIEESTILAMGTFKTNPYAWSTYKDCKHLK